MVLSRQTDIHLSILVVEGRITAAQKNSNIRTIEEIATKELQEVCKAAVSWDREPIGCPEQVQNTGRNPG